MRSSAAPVLVNSPDFFFNRTRCPLSIREACSRYLSPESTLYPQKRFLSPGTSPLPKRSSIGLTSGRIAAESLCTESPQIPSQPSRIPVHVLRQSLLAESPLHLCTESPQTPSQPSRIPVRVLRQSLLGIDDATTTVKVLFSAYHEYNDLFI